MLASVDRIAKEEASEGGRVAGRGTVGCQRRAAVWQDYGRLAPRRLQISGQSGEALWPSLQN